MIFEAMFRSCLSASADFEVEMWVTSLVLVQILVETHLFRAQLVRVVRSVANVLVFAFAIAELTENSLISIRLADLHLSADERRIF